MPSAKSLAVTFGAFMVCLLVTKYAVKPLAVKFAVPILQDL